MNKPTEEQARRNIDKLVAAVDVPGIRVIRLHDPSPVFRILQLPEYYPWFALRLRGRDVHVSVSACKTVHDCNPVQYGRIVHSLLINRYQYSSWQNQSILFRRAVDLIHDHFSGDFDGELE